MSLVTEVSEAVMEAAGWSVRGDQARQAAEAAVGSVADALERESRRTGVPRGKQNALDAAARWIRERDA